MDIRDIIDKIESLDENYYNNAYIRENSLIKPPHSLGVLEDIACKICGITCNDKPILNKKRLLVFSSDNGVYEEGVSSCPQNITVDQTINLTRGITGASSLTYYWNDEIEVYDLGVNFDIDKYIDNLNKKYNINIVNKIINKKISYSTKNISKEPAMTKEQLFNAIDVGFCAVKKAKEEKIDILGVGEMGICNTTTSTAILSVLSGTDPVKITGRGAGLTDESYQRKINIIKKSIDRAYKNNIKNISMEFLCYFNDIKNLENNSFDSNLVYNLIAELGGYDIAAMVGAYIGASYYKIPIVIDGYISIISALLSVLLNKKVRDYIFTSHQSMEPGYKIASDILGIRSMFNLDMRLGEGSGCVIAWRIIDSALAVHNGMKTFDEVNIDDSYLEKIR